MTDILTAAREREAAGDVSGAIELLVDALADGPDQALESALLALRHRAFASVEDGRSDHATWPPPVEDHFPGGGVPEVAAADLDAELVRSALLHHGSLLVRGLVDEARAASLRRAIDAAFAGAAIHRDDPHAEVGDGFVPFEPEPRYPFGVYERAFANFGSGVLGVDSPRAMHEMIAALEAAGVRGLLRDYFGEPAAFSVKKTTLRRTEPDSLAGWHQDGAFLGTQTRALNIWTALSPCGVDAPGLDVFPDRFEELVPTGGDEIYDWSVSNETASRYDLSRVVRPAFDTGDALLFDHMTLHRTGVDPAMTRTRYAIEMWFFAPSTYPTDQIPILF
ncbi:MAG: phytanoyl-CoA dioxygenase family protein [Acidimicrobiales bacterium]|nr:phytanoyl-CoA dioxygenase family protein [Acidimicrobiales bacterium]